MANQWAHLEPFSDQDTTRALDTIVRLLRAVGAEAQATSVLKLGADNITDDGATTVVGSVVHPPVRRYRPADGSTIHIADDDEVVEFRDRDDDHLAWVAAHSSGFVINIGRSGRGLAAFHRATCGTITSRPPYTRSYMKVCSQSLTALDTWALQRNGVAVSRCGICLRPEAARTTAWRMLPSKYDGLRSFLGQNGNAPITLTFTEIDQLVGGLPRSAWLYHLWWRNDDPSRYHCRSWGDAGYIARPDIPEQRVTFTPKHP